MTYCWLQINKKQIKSHWDQLDSTTKHSFSLSTLRTISSLNNPIRSDTIYSFKTFITAIDYSLDLW